jgi:hypothetical protein
MKKSVDDTCASNVTKTPPTLHPLTVFTFVWACQALVHQEFYSGWLHAGNGLGWAVTIAGVATALRPSSLWMFCALLCSSVIYNVAKWPFVVNHILLETIINVTLLAAIVRSLFERRSSVSPSDSLRDAVYQRISPVIWVLLVIMYWFAFLAKLNTDFMNPDVSCVVAMYADLLRRFPFLPNTPAAHQAAIVLTLVVEGLIPLLLCFRRSRGVAIVIGLPFHLVLGLLGHRTFSALAYALYVLLCLDGFVPLANTGLRWIVRHTTVRTRLWLRRTTVTTVLATVGLLIVTDLTGSMRSKVIGVGVYQIPWMIWIMWSLLVSICCVAGLTRIHLFGRPEPGMKPSVRPGLLWAPIPLVLLIGFSQYLGLKTETCFTMYSNLRTEGDWNNHLFMPALRIGPWQGDLVTILSTDHPELVSYLERDELITFFELRRIVSATATLNPFTLTYLRSGQQQALTFANGQLSQTESWGRHPSLLGKLLYFRPVSALECVPCHH